MLPAQLFLGIVSFQVLFIAIEWAVFKRLEYGLYILYIVCISSYFLIKYLVADVDYLHIGNSTFDKHITDRALSFLSFGLYIKFGRRFLGTKQTPRLNRYFMILENAIIAYSFLSFIYVVITGNIMAELQVFLYVFGLAFIISIVLLIRLYRSSGYSKYLILGSIALAVGACLALYVGAASPHFGVQQDDTNIFLQCGMIADFIFLNIGLVVKTKSLQAREIEKQAAIEQERSRISAELHDNLGGGLSTIRLMTEMIRNPQFGLNESYLDKISVKSRELVQSINEIVWYLNNTNEELAATVAYIRQFAGRYLEETGIELVFNEPEPIQNIQISGESRRHILLLIKEVLHNIVKHARATCVTVTIRITNDMIINIEDNGNGIPDIDMAISGSSRNGLKNMQQRVAILKGKLEILSREGTTVTFSVPLRSLYNESAM